MTTVDTVANASNTCATLLAVFNCDANKVTVALDTIEAELRADNELTDELLAELTAVRAALVSWQAVANPYSLGKRLALARERRLAAEQGELVELLDADCLAY